MLTHEENDLLTRVTNGAPMGEFIKRHFWIPAAIACKVEADGKPLRVRLLGEDYVLFRATDGRLGFFDEACPHRGASLALALARNEDNALTCIYHGWKFRVDGAAEFQPFEFLGSADAAVIAVRRALLKSVRQFMAQETVALAPKPTIDYHAIRPIARVFEGTARWQELL